MSEGTIKLALFDCWIAFLLLLHLGYQNFTVVIVVEIYVLVELGYYGFDFALNYLELELLDRFKQLSVFRVKYLVL